jgi:hypothetical protein
MTTPAYQHHNFSMPRIDATRQSNIDSIANNFTAEQLDRALWGAAGWTTGYTRDEQGRVSVMLCMYRDGVTWQRVTFTYNTSGTGAGRIDKAVREFSADNGATWARIGEHRFTYDAAGNMNPEMTWSD